MACLLRIQPNTIPNSPSLATFIDDGGISPGYVSIFASDTPQQVTCEIWPLTLPGQPGNQISVGSQRLLINNQPKNFDNAQANGNALVVTFSIGGDTTRENPGYWNTVNIQVRDSVGTASMSFYFYKQTGLPPAPPSPPPPPPPSPPPQSPPHVIKRPSYSPAKDVKKKRR